MQARIFSPGAAPMPEFALPSHTPVKNRRWGYARARWQNLPRPYRQLPINRDASNGFQSMPPGCFDLSSIDLEFEIKPSVKTDTSRSPEPDSRICFDLYHQLRSLVGAPLRFDVNFPKNPNMLSKLHILALF
jgi:hypothetical protein